MAYFREKASTQSETVLASDYIIDDNDLDLVLEDDEDDDDDDET